MNISKEKLVRAIETFTRYLEKKGFFDPDEASKSEVMEYLLTQEEEENLDSNLDFLATQEGCEELMRQAEFRRLRRNLLQEG